MNHTLSQHFSRLAIGLALIASTTAFAEMPAGHPSPAQANDMLLPHKAPSAAQLPNSGKVLNVIDANEYSYIEVSHGDGKPSEWLAAQKMPLKIGSTIRYDEGALMTNFYSKLLKRTFASVMFVNYVAVTPTP